MTWLDTIHITVHEQCTNEVPQTYVGNHVNKDCYLKSIKTAAVELSEDNMHVAQVVLTYALSHLVAYTPYGNLTRHCPDP